MTFEDWRDADAVVVARLYAVEEIRWRQSLGWDTRDSWAIVEEGRRCGNVPGWILRSPSGEVCGWTYYLLFDGELQIGGLTAKRATDLRLLLDRVIDSPEASLATSVSGFIYPAPASLLSALARRRFAVHPSLYLSTALDLQPASSTPVQGRTFRRFDERDVFPAARLFANAYEAVPGAECFAPHGRLEEWVRYLRQLLETPACGQWLPEASFVLDAADPPGLNGLVLTTSVSATMAHVAQLVVGRPLQGQGVGDHLLSCACDSARSRGYEQMSLMVDADNTAARTLYARRKFDEVSAFVYARRKGHVRWAGTLQKQEAGIRTCSAVVSSR